MHANDATFAPRVSDRWVANIAAIAVLLTSLTSAYGQSKCRPVLAISGVKISDMTPPSLERQWTAVVTVDASRCVANSSGYFDIGFSRLKENAPDIDFAEEFAWLSPRVAVSVDFAADEAVEQFWIARVSPCVCAP